MRDHTYTSSLREGLRNGLKKHLHPLGKTNYSCSNTFVSQPNITTVSLNTGPRLCDTQWLTSIVGLAHTRRLSVNSLTLYVVCWRCSTNPNQPSTVKPQPYIMTHTHATNLIRHSKHQLCIFSQHSIAFQTPVCVQSTLSYCPHISDAAETFSYTQARF